MLFKISVHQWLVLLGVITALWSGKAETSLSVAWDPSPSKDAVGYHLYYGDVNGGQVNRISVGNQRTGVVSGLMGGNTYFVYVTSVNRDGVESPPSNVLSYTVPAITEVQFISNGSFESGFNGWTVEGNQRISTRSSTHESSAVQFNYGQLPATGELSTRYATIRGVQYVISFDLGAFSLVNQSEQRLEITATGDNLLTSEIRSVFAPGNGMRWSSQTVQFVADSAVTTLTFRDVSTRTTDVDLFLDNVEIWFGAR